MRGRLFDNLENTKQEGEIFVNQNDYALLVNLDGSVYAAQGSMVAYKGNVDFDHKGAGMARFAKSMMTGEGMPLMKISGKGDVYLASSSALVHILELEDDEISITSRNVLAFTEGIEWDISVIRAGIMGFAAGGVFNTTLKGRGSVAITSYGTPIVVPVTNEDVYADVNSIMAWSTSLRTSIKSSFKTKQLIGRGSGESFQMAFSGSGFIVVQPGEQIKA